MLIELTRGKSTIIDAEDADLAGWSWHAKLPRKKLAGWPPPGDQDLNRKSCLVIPMYEVLERKDREQGIPYDSDADKTDEEIVVGLMEITALSLTDVLDDEPSYE